MKKLTREAEWKPGDPLEMPRFTMQSIAIADLSARDRYKMLVSAIVPRPIALVSTMNAAGLANLAPFSFFNGVGTTPPAIMLSIVPKNSGAKKDTLKNIEETGEFVINGVSEWMLGPVHHCSVEHPYGEDEAEVVGLKMEPSLKVRPGRVLGSVWQFECKLYGSMPVGDGSVGSGTVVVGEIVHAHVAAECFHGGAIDFGKLSPLARIGGMNYEYGGEQVAMPDVGFAPRD